MSHKASVCAAEERVWLAAYKYTNASACFYATSLWAFSKRTCVGRTGERATVPHPSVVPAEVSACVFCVCALPVNRSEDGVWAPRRSHVVPISQSRPSDLWALRRSLSQATRPAIINWAFPRALCLCVCGKRQPGRACDPNSVNKMAYDSVRPGESAARPQIHLLTGGRGGKWRLICRMRSVGISSHFCCQC